MQWIIAGVLLCVLVYRLRAQRQRRANARTVEEKVDIIEQEIAGTQSAYEYIEWQWVWLGVLGIVFMVLAGVWFLFPLVVIGVVGVLALSARMRKTRLRKLAAEIKSVTGDSGRRSA